jgi:hypothetical protein
MFDSTHRGSVEASAPVVWHRGATRRYTIADHVLVALARIDTGTRQEVAAACLSIYPDVFEMTREGHSAAHRVSIAFVHTGKARRHGWVKHRDDGRFTITTNGRARAEVMVKIIAEGRCG